MPLWYSRPKYVGESRKSIKSINLERDNKTAFNVNGNKYPGEISNVFYLEID